MFQMTDVTKGCVASNFNASNPIACDSFIYDRTFFIETFTSKLDLVCGSKNLQKLLITLMMLGLLFGSFFGGLMSDHLGRKRTLYMAQLVIVVTCFAAAFVNDYASYATLHFIYCTMCPFIWITNQTICIELFSNKYKKMLLATKAFQWFTTPLVLTIAAYFIRDWVYLQVRKNKYNKKKNSDKLWYFLADICSHAWDGWTADVAVCTGVSTMVGAEWKEGGGLETLVENSRS